MDSLHFMNISFGSQQKTVVCFPEKLEMDANLSKYKGKSSFVLGYENFKTEMFSKFPTSYSANQFSGDTQKV